MTNSPTVNFQSAFPLSVTLENQFEGQDLAILYIVNKLDTKAKSQEVKIRIENQSTTPHHLKGFGFAPVDKPTLPKPSDNATLCPANSTFAPDEKQYNLAIAVKPGVLRTDAVEAFSTILYQGIQASLGTQNNCVVQGPFTRSSDQALVWYVVFEKDLQKKQTAASSLSQKNQIIPNHWEGLGVAFPSGKTIADATLLPNGSMLAVATDHSFYLKSAADSGVWQPVLSNLEGLSVAVKPDGKIVYAGVDEWIYELTSLSDTPRIVPNSYAIVSLSVLSDGGMIGVSHQGYNYLWHYSKNGTAWEAVDTSLILQTVYTLPNDYILGLSEDNHWHIRKGLQEDWKKMENPPVAPLKGMTYNSQQGWLGFSNQNVLTPKQAAANFFDFTLQGISAAAGTGSRNTQMEFLFGNVAIAGNDRVFHFKRSLSVNIINHQGHSFAPLHFGVVGENTLLNKPLHKQELTVYFQSNEKIPIHIGPETKVTFTFSYKDPDSQLIYFGDSSEVNAYRLNPGTNFKPKTAFDDPDNRVVQITADFSQSAGQTINTAIFNFSNIHISGENGLAILEVSVQNLPGYWDSVFQVPVVKVSSELNKELELGVAGSPGRSGSNGSRIDFMSGGKLNKVSKHYAVSIEEEDGLNLYGTASKGADTGARGVPTSQNLAETGQPVKIRKTDLLIPEGRLAINDWLGYRQPDKENTDIKEKTKRPEKEHTNKNEKLYVNGDTFLNGHLGVNQDLGVAGQSTFSNTAVFDSGITLSNPNNMLLIGNASGLAGGHACLSMALPNGFNYWPIYILRGEQDTLFAVDNLGDISNFGNATIGNNLNVKGRAQDKTGYITPVGAIIAYGGKDAPQGWLLCDGNSIPSQYSELIQVVGNNTPDLRNRFIVGAGQEYASGNIGGEKEHELTIDEMPDHNHEILNIICTIQSDCTASGGGRDTFNAPQNVTTTSTGGSQPHNNMPPYYALTYIIKC